MSNKIFYCLVGMTVLLFSHLSYAQDEQASEFDQALDMIEIRGFLKNETAYRTAKTQKFTKILNIMQIEAEVYPTDNTELHLIGRNY